MILLVTGGSASGKSEYAENRALQMAKEGQRPLIYLAAMMPFGKDAEKRIERHRQLRAGKGFETVERYTAVEALCRGDGPDSEAFRNQAKGAVVMLECMSNLAANEVFSPEGAKEHAYEAICDGILHLKEQAADVCVVTNEIFSDGMVYDKETENYQRLLGRINAYLAEISDVCYEVVYGIPLRIK